MSGQERWRGWAGAGNWTGNWTGSWAGVRPPSGLRIGDAEREAAVSALGEHYAAGRLTKEEYDERSGLAWSARTGADLAPLFNDLPRAATPPPQPSRPQPTRPRLHVPFLPVLLVVIGLAALTHAFWLVLLVVGVFWWAGLFRWGWRRRGWHGHTGYR